MRNSKSSNKKEVGTIKAYMKKHEYFKEKT
jgi:hypothetical protein